MRTRFVIPALLSVLPTILSAQAPAPQAPAPAPKHHHHAAKARGFVGCTQTKLFHKPGCAHVADIEKAGTKVMFTTRAEAIQAGYKPCEDCKP
ncbi:MAG TPA: Ada metal-binding domain-containing protein [Holophagaceae bacterium]|jgi:hypothetical protein|nr:Ada metal-binding domain-containing protein [Holophagaceae bacterium]